MKKATNVLIDKSGANKSPSEAVPCCMCGHPTDEHHESCIDALGYADGSVEARDWMQGFRDYEEAHQIIDYNDHKPAYVQGVICNEQRWLAV